MADKDSKNMEITGRNTEVQGGWSVTSQLQLCNYSQVRLPVWGPVISIFLGP
jgi:hypothetical protein